MTNLLYVPVKSKILKTKKLTDLEKYFKIDLSNFNNFKHMPGQFVQVTIPGVGEAPISIASAENKEKTLDLVVRNVGSLTNLMHKLDSGDYIGIRGPFGKGFPMNEFKNHNLLIVGGGIGLVPLRSVIQYYINNKKYYKSMTIFYGAKTDRELLFVDEYKIWKQKGINLYITIDKETPTWKGNVGLITTLFDKINMDYINNKILVCGPPIMYKFVLLQLIKRAVSAKNIYLSLERQMKCGVGKCAHCAIGSYHVCIDGPVFTYDFLKDKKEAL